MNADSPTVAIGRRHPALLILTDQSISVPPGASARAIDISNGIGLSRLRSPKAVPGSKAVTTASFSARIPIDLETARRVEPTPIGPSDVQYSSVAAGCHRGVWVTSLSTEKTSVLGRRMTMWVDAAGTPG